MASTDQGPSHEAGSRRHSSHRGIGRRWTQGREPRPPRGRTRVHVLQAWKLHSAGRVTRADTKEELHTHRLRSDRRWRGWPPGTSVFAHRSRSDSRLSLSTCDLPAPLQALDPHCAPRPSQGGTAVPGSWASKLRRTRGIRGHAAKGRHSRGPRPPSVSPVCSYPSLPLWRRGVCHDTGKE